MAKCGMSMGAVPIGVSASPSESALLLCTKPHPVLCFWLRVLKSRSAKRERQDTKTQEQARCTDNGGDQENKIEHEL